MRHELLTQRALLSQCKKGTLSQHFVTHVVPPHQNQSTCLDVKPDIEVLTQRV